MVALCKQFGTACDDVFLLAGDGVSLVAELLEISNLDGLVTQPLFHVLLACMIVARYSLELVVAIFT